MKTLLLAALLAPLAGCAVLDPHDLLARRIGNGGPPEGTALAPTVREQAFDFVWRRINDHYVDPHLRGVDWAQAGARYRPLALAAPNDDLFWHTLDQMTAELGDSHTRVLSSKQYEFTKKKQVKSLGLQVRELDGELLITAVSPGSEAALVGVRPGNKVLAIDGTPAAQWWQARRAKARKGSTDAATLKSVVRLLNSGAADEPGEQVALTLERNDASVFTVTLLRAVVDAKDGVRSLRLASNYGYLRLTGFDARLKDEAEKALEKIKDTRGMLFDLRGNGGGSGEFARALAASWVDGKVKAGKTITRDGKPVALLFGLMGERSLALELTGKPHPYRAPLVILTDSGSASASELLSATLQGLGRAKVVGETTCGCLLGYLGYANVPGGGALAYSEIDFETVDGKRVEGVGVVPDLVVHPRRADLVSGRDVQLEAALALLDKMTAPASEAKAGEANAGEAKASEVKASQK